MSEEFLHYLWQRHLFDRSVYSLANGERLEIISPGLRNTDAGPDFYNVRIKLEDTLWVGSCEMHVYSSDWYRHEHHINPLYDNVILHVVYKNDQPVVNSKGIPVPTIELSFDAELLDIYQRYQLIQDDIRCKQYIRRIEPIYLADLMSKMVVERLIQRAQLVHQLLEASHYDWELCAMIWLGKAFGFKVNEAPFEMLIRSIPLAVLQRSAHQLFTLEALLFGQAGLLHENFQEAYPQQLYREYTFLRHKFNLSPIDGHLWKKMRIRPANFPALRIAQLAAFIHKSPAFFQQLLEIKSSKQILSFFEITASEYWNNHYQLDVPARVYPKKLSQSSILLLAINALVPLMFAYGHEKDIDEYRELAVRILEEIEPEQNSIIQKWHAAGITAHHASESQGLIQLYNKHCLLQRCLQCEMFNQIMTKKLYAY
ncbi:MAG: DUF2851 family protein [Bacteroidales bacterium]